MSIASTLSSDVPRLTRQVETTRLLREAATAAEPRREHLIQEVIVLNAGVARSVARRYANRGIPADDLEQVAYLALVRAARKFDGDKAEDFLTYAVPTMRGELKRHFRDHGWTVRPPRRMQELQTAVLRTRESLRDHAGEPPTPAEIARRLGAEEADVLEALTVSGCFQPLSLDLQMAGDGSDSDARSLADVILAQHDDLSAAEARAVLAPALAQLSDRERLIIRLRFFEDRTQTEIGAVVGVTQMQVSRILSGIMRKLREHLIEDVDAHGSRGAVSSSKDRATGQQAHAASTSSETPAA